MQSIFPHIRKPVEREEAARYVLYTLLSFATSVSVTRLFLELTGYPQLGKGPLHIAHVLWGGLLLFVAALFPLIWANRWALALDAVLAGAGVGLFIDEVGKFITRTNDYFYPAAAPIIYAFFLITVLLYLELRKPRQHSTRSALYHVLNDLEEVLDQDLSSPEREHILKQLCQIEKSSDNPDFSHLINKLKDFITVDSLTLVPHRAGTFERLYGWYLNIEKQWIKRKEMRLGLAGCLFALGLWTLRYPILVVTNLQAPDHLMNILADLIQSGLLNSSSNIIWFNARLGLQSAVGLIQIISAVLLVFQKDRRGIAFSYLGLLLSISSVNLLMFYFDQFSTIIMAIIQFILLLCVLYYRRRFLNNRFTD
ncbi:MAG: hypothetical protein PHQ40_07465 [Anaerolineaceae bacterium]|nr:hypothetical protein [Anaerolineaceae bacterium]